jgi:hypothetical protein
MLLYRIGITLVSIALTASAAASANATQVIPQVQYTNDNIEQGGVIRACVATAAMINPPAPEMVNLQFLEIFGNGQIRFAYKVTAGDIDWNQQSAWREESLRQIFPLVSLITRTPLSRALRRRANFSESLLMITCEMRSPGRFSRVTTA